MIADLVVTGARVYTLDPAKPLAEAIACRRDRIIAVGRDSDAEALAGVETKRVNLHGRTVIPGIIDSHLHLLSFGYSLETIDLRGASSIPDAVALVREVARRARPGEWVQGSGWDRNLFGRLPGKQDLDAVAPSNPVLLASKDAHALWVNSLALRHAGIGPRTPDPADGKIVRDPDTLDPSGILVEGARAAVFGAVPEPSIEGASAALANAIRVAASKGITGVHTFEESATFTALQALRASGGQAIRVRCHLWKDSLDHAIAIGLRTGFGDDFLRVGSLKLFLDGALGSQTALMLEPYSGSNDKGIATLAREEFKQLVLRAAAAGIAVAVHAIGDAANRIAIEVFKETSGEWKRAGLRQRIEHVQLLAPGDARRLGTLGVIASMQPVHATSDWLVAERHWAGRTHLSYAWRDVLSSGAPLAFGSDSPVESIDPLLGIYAAVTRQTPHGQPAGGWHPEQRLSSGEALRAYTLGAAFASGEEATRGSIQPGKLADIVVLSDDPFSGPPERFVSTTVQATIVGGHLVHGSL